MTDRAEQAKALIEEAEEFALDVQSGWSQKAGDCFYDVIAALTASEAEVTRLQAGITEALGMFDTRFTDEPEGFGSEVSPLVPLRYHLERLSQPTTDTNGAHA